MPALLGFCFALDAGVIDSCWKGCEIFFFSMHIGTVCKQTVFAQILSEGCRFRWVNIDGMEWTFWFWEKIFQQINCKFVMKFSEALLISCIILFFEYSFLHFFRNLHRILLLLGRDQTFFNRLRKYYSLYSDLVECKKRAQEKMLFQHFMKIFVTTKWNVKNSFCR